MVQEGYMLHLNKDGQQYKIKQRIEGLIGKEQTEAFYDVWLSNHTTKSDIDSLHAWGFNSVRLPMHFNLFTLPVDAEPVAGKNTWLPAGFAFNGQPDRVVPVQSDVCDSLICTLLRAVREMT